MSIYNNRLIDECQYIISATSLIGITTFALSLAGVKPGNVFGKRFKSKAELAGGIIFILID